MRAVVVSVALGLCFAACGGRSRLDTGAIDSDGGSGAGAGGARATGGTAGEHAGTPAVGGSSTGGVAGTGGFAGVAGSAGEAGSGGGAGRPPLPEGGCTDDGFCTVVPELTANTLQAVWGSGPRDVWAVGDGGVIVHYDGARWKRVASGTVARLLGVSGTSADDVWFVGEDGLSIHYDGLRFDSGVGPTTSLHLAAVHAIAPDDVWIASGTLRYPVQDGDWGAVYHYDGNRWSDERPVRTRSFYRALWAASPDDVWLTGDSTYHFDGDEWFTVDPADGVDVWGSTGPGAWVARANQLTYLDGSTTTVSFRTGLGWIMTGVWASSARDLFVVGSEGNIVRGQGDLWQTMTSGTTRTLNAIWGSSPADVWAVGQWGTILHFDGVSWSSTRGDADLEDVGTLRTLWGATDDEQWIASDGGIFSYDGAGALSASGPSSELRTSYYSIWGTSRDDVVAVGSAGFIAEFDGREWSLVAAPALDTLTGVWGHGHKMLAVGGHFGVVRLGAAPWELEPVTGGAGAPLRAVWGSSEEDIWVSSVQGAEMGHFTGGRWESVPSSAFAAALWGAAADDIWGVSSRISHYDGETWTWQELPDETPALRAISGCSPRDIWAVGNSGTVVHYDGERWAVLESGTTNSLEGVRCSPGGVWAVGEGGIVLRNLRRP